MIDTTKGLSACIKAFQKAIVEANNFSRQMEECDKLYKPGISGAEGGERLRKMITVKPETDWTKIVKESMDVAKVDKCEWKDGKFEPCNEMDLYLNKISGHQCDNPLFEKAGIKYCSFCGADIRQVAPAPLAEPNPIIRKSGGTWVARFDGVDYLYTGVNLWESTGSHPYLHSENNYENNIIELWNPITEIEITDEIAKLRPMVINEIVANPVVLYGVNEDNHRNNYIVGRGCVVASYRSISLATVSDLEPTE